jgi:predicted RNA-binding Zn ribbon-like protein
MSNYSHGAVLATDLVNTYEVFAREEHLGSVEALADFAADHGFDTGNVTTADLDRLHTDRPSLRSAMLSNNEEEAVTALNDLLATTQPRPRLVTSIDGEWIFSYADPKAGLADQILAEATAEVLNEIRNDRLRWFSTCLSSTCKDVFVDQSRNHSRRYCTPDVCGNREAQRAHRSRQANRTGS